MDNVYTEPGQSSMGKISKAGLVNKMTIKIFCIYLIVKLFFKHKKLLFCLNCSISIVDGH
jgi:hypothetical protein